MASRAEPAEEAEHAEIQGKGSALRYGNARAKNAHTFFHFRVFSLFRVFRARQRLAQSGKQVERRMPLILSVLNVYFGGD